MAVGVGVGDGFGVGVAVDRRVRICVSVGVAAGVSVGVWVGVCVSILAGLGTGVGVGEIVLSVCWIEGASLVRTGDVCSGAVSDGVATVTAVAACCGLSLPQADSVIARMIDAAIAGIKRSINRTSPRGWLSLLLYANAGVGEPVRVKERYPGFDSGQRFSGAFTRPDQYFSTISDWSWNISLTSRIPALPPRAAVISDR